MSILIDIAVIALIAVFAFIGYRKGLVKTLLNFAGVFIALIAAFYIASPLSSFVFDTFFSDRIHNGVNKAIVNSAADTVTGAVAAVPDYIKKGAKALDINVEKVISDSDPESGVSFAEDVAETITQKVARPIVTRLLAIILFIILFVLLRVLIKVIANALNLVARLPGLNLANRTLGAVIGFAEGLLIAYVCCFAIMQIADIKGGSFLGISMDTLSDTYIFSKLGGLFDFKIK